MRVDCSSNKLIQLPNSLQELSHLGIQHLITSKKLPISFAIFGVQFKTLSRWNIKSVLRIEDEGGYGGEQSRAHAVTVPFSSK
jgi:hypothetical protein